MATMRDIQAEIRNVLDAVEDGAELTDEQRAQIDEYLAELATAEADKVDAFAAVLRREKARVDFLKGEEKRVSSRRASVERAVEHMRSRYLAVMVEAGRDKIKGNTSSIGVQTRAVLVVDDASRLPATLRDEVTTTIYQPRRAEIERALSDGAEVPGAHIEERQHLVVR